MGGAGERRQSCFYRRTPRLAKEYMSPVGHWKQHSQGTVWQGPFNTQSVHHACLAASLQLDQHSSEIFLMLALHERMWVQMDTSTCLRDVLHGAAAAHQGIRTSRMVALLWFYLHPEDKVDLTNSLFLLETYCRATTHAVHGQISLMRTAFR